MDKFVATSLILIVFIVLSSAVGTVAKAGDEISWIEQEGTIEGSIVSISACDLQPGDKRYCKLLTMKNDSDKLQKTTFFAGVDVLSKGVIIYNGSKKLSDISLEKIAKEMLVPGNRVALSMKCGGDEGCDLVKINILK